ncbi:MAG: DUF2076 domain-containing protein [Pseudorhodoplanes sp.]
MTPQERKLVDELFERLATLESRPRETDAEQAIRQGLRIAPNATYALVQTVLLQDEALRKADERIRELEGDGPPPQQQGGFLDSMRDTLFGSPRPRSSVPQTGGDRPMGVPPGFGTGYAQPNAQPNAYGQPPQAPAGGSFLGTAAAAAVGVIGGSMLMNSMRNMLGSNHPASGQTAADLSGSNSANASANPWGGNDASSSDLARQAGLDNMGQSGSGNRTGLMDQQNQKEDQPYQTADSGDQGDDAYEDDGGFDLGGDSDFV